MMKRTVRQQFFTLPNLLSVLRIAMIPAIVMFCREGRALPAALLLVSSGATDLLDGWIARRFDAVSDVGKILDPIADKLTIAAVLYALLQVHPVLWGPLIILIIKEVVMGVMGAIAVGCTAFVPSARWHGKTATALLYATMFVHILWQDIPPAASNILCVVCEAMMIVSTILYMRDHLCNIHLSREEA